MTYSEWLIWIQNKARKIKSMSGQNFIEESDLFQEGVVGYLKAVNKPDGYKKVAIIGHMMDSFNKYGIPQRAYDSGVRVENDYDLEEFIDTVNHVECVENEILLDEIIKNLSKEEKNIFTCLILGSSLTEIGNGRGISVSRVSQIVKGIRDKLVNT